MFAHPAHSRARRAYGTALPMTPEERNKLQALKNGETLQASTQRVEMSEEERKALTTAVVWGGVGIATVVTLGAVQIFGINPWIVKAFKPEWSYGRRLAASFGVSFVAGTLISVAKGIGGVSATGATSTPAATK